MRLRCSQNCKSLNSFFRRKVKDCFRYLEFLTVPFLRFPLNTLGAQGAVVVSIPRIVHVCACIITVHAYVHRRNFWRPKRMIMPNSCGHLCWVVVSCFLGHSTRLLVFLLSVSLLLTAFTPMVSFSPSHPVSCNICTKSLEATEPHINYPPSY